MRDYPAGPLRRGIRFRLRLGRLGPARLPSAPEPSGITKEVISTAPTFSSDPDWKWTDPGRERELHAHYGLDYMGHKVLLRALHRLYHHPIARPRSSSILVRFETMPTTNAAILSFA